MKKLLENFSKRQGRKVYASNLVTQERIRNEVFTQNLMDETFKGLLEAKRGSIDTNNIYYDSFSGEGSNKSKTKINANGSTKALDKAAQKHKFNDGNEEETISKEKEREKCLSELLFDRFKAKLPEIHGNKRIPLSTDRKIQPKKEVDSNFNRRKNYDAWYIDPNMRIKRLKSFIKSVKTP